MSTWLVIGSSPSAPESLGRARQEHEIDTTITTNGGIYLEPQPTYYFISDTMACKLYRQDAWRAFANGTVCLTLLRDRRAMIERGVEWMEAVPNGHPYEPFQLSGLWCCEYAARNGATTILMVGMEGYHPNTDYPQYFYTKHQEMVLAYNRDHTKTIIQPLMPRLVHKYPAVSWVCYGSPLFTVEAPNWKVR